MSVAVVVTLFAGALLGSDALGVGQVRPRDGHRYAAHRPLPDLCAVMTAGRLCRGADPASTEPDQQDRDVTGCYWESRRHGESIPATLRVEVQRPDPVVSEGGSETERR